MRWNQIPTHFGRSLPQFVNQLISVGGEHQVKTSGNGLVGIVHGTPAMPTRMVITNAYAVLNSNETGAADSSNYTQAEVRVGTYSDYDVVAQLRTSSGYAAGTVISEKCYVQVRPGQLIWAYWTKVGGAYDYNNEFALCSIDLVGERIP